MTADDDKDHIEAQLQGWFDAMLARDTDRVMAFCHPDIRLAMHFGDVPLPFVGTTTGSDAARRRTALMLSSWRFKDVNLVVLEMAPPTVRALLTMTPVHQWTGLSTTVAIRQVFMFEDGLIRSFDGYMDTPRFNAFLRYVGLAPRKPKTSTTIGARP